MSLELMNMLDERLAVFEKRDLPKHLSLLSKWESELNEVEEWYRSQTEEFLQFADSMKQAYDKEQEAKTTPLAIVFHDHTYCLEAYRKPLQIVVPHACSRKCAAAVVSNPGNLSDLSPLEIPLRLGWQRVIVQRCGMTDGKDAYYVTPCSRRLRNMDEIKIYMDLTRTKGLSGINFTFDPLCNLVCPPPNHMEQKALVYIPDISGGKERVPVSCVNEFSRTEPDCAPGGTFHYITTRTLEQSSHVTRTDHHVTDSRPNGAMLEANCHVTDAAGSEMESDGSRTKPAVESENVPNMEPGFLVCCSCTDGCSNRSKCECWQLTLAEGKVLGNSHYSVGYVHQRLKRPQHSAVYECNSHCKCRGNCSNSVVRNGVVHRLQLFHTGNPHLNWGLRTLDDIPMGTFVCSYVGHVYTEMTAETNALQHGDEYFADLDYIEVMEFQKTGYESEVVVSETSSDSSEANSRSRLSSPATPSEKPDSELTTPTLSRGTSCETTSSVLSDDVIYISSDSDDDATSGTSSVTVTKSMAGPTSSPRKRPSPSRSSHSSSVLPPGDQIVNSTPLAPPGDHTPNFTPLAPPGDDHTANSTPLAPSPVKRFKKNGTRQFFNENFSYIIDAKNHGNMARYINHSCNPNLFVQNVFVDTHDLRFPWVAFFARRRIKAMEELTWDYNYDVGSVDNKEIICLCGSENCRKRLL